MIEIYEDKTQPLEKDLMSVSDGEFWKELENVNMSMSQLSEYTDF